MTFDDMIAGITPEAYENLQRAIETGRWADGRRLTDEQRAHCMEAVIAWGEKFLPERERVGFIDRGVKDEGEMCDSHSHDEPTLIRFVDAPTRH